MADDSATPPFTSDFSNRVINIPGPAQLKRPPGDHGDGRRLIVGREIRLTGEITACNTLVVEGHVDATLNESHRIEIAESGYFKGKVDIAVAEINGHFEGELIARERLIIRKSGRVAGKVSYTEIEIERGGEISGEIELISAEVSENDQKDDAADAAN